MASTSGDALPSWIAAQVSDIQRQVFDMPQVDGGCPEVFRLPPSADLIVATHTINSQAGGEVQCLVLDS